MPTDLIEGTNRPRGPELRSATTAHRAEPVAGGKDSPAAAFDAPALERARSRTEPGAIADAALLIPHKPPREWLNLTLMILMVMIAGCTPVAARLAMREMPMFSTGVLRFLIASTLLAATTPLFIRRDAKAARPIERRDCPRILLCAFLCVPINQAMFLSGVKLASAAHAGLLYALNPVLVYLFTLALRQVGFSVRMAAAALLAFAGAAVIGMDGLRAAHDVSFFVGDLLLVGAVASWAAYSVLAAPLGEKYGALRALTFIMVAGTVMYLPLLLVDARELDFLHLSWWATGGFAYMTVLTSYFNYMLWFILLIRMNVNRLAVGMSAAPLFSVFAASVVCGDPITRWLALGAGLVLAGIALSNWEKLRAMRTYGAPGATRSRVE